MSVMILPDQTYQEVVRALQCSRGDSVSYLAGRYDITEEIEKLRVANTTCYNNRYKENIRLQSITYTTKHNGISNFQLLKSLECIRYQLEPEFVSFNEQFLDKLIHAVMADIIHDINEYEEADWG